MEIRHIPKEAMRAYLLGMLSDENAAALEEHYFLDRTCLAELKAVERQLIGQHLDGLLVGEEARHFTRLYLDNPARRRIVEQVESERKGPGHNWASLRLVAAGVLVTVLGLVVWFSLNRAPRENPESKSPVIAMAAPVTLRLAPGVRMGAGDATRLELDRADRPVLLVAELPGPQVSASYGAQLSLVNQHGGLEPKLSAGPEQTRRSGNGQELAVPVKPGTLTTGDYILELITPAGAVQTTYLFHVSTPR